MWSSKHQATLGGIAMKLRVAKLDGARISLGHAFVRFVAAIPSLFLLIGVLIIPFTNKKQALHDIIARTIFFENE